ARTTALSAASKPSNTTSTIKTQPYSNKIAVSIFFSPLLLQTKRDHEQIDDMSTCYGLTVQKLILLNTPGFFRHDDMLIEILVVTPHRVSICLLRILYLIFCDM